MTRFSKAELDKNAKILRKKVKDGDGLPKHMNFTGMDRVTYYLPITSYLGLYLQRNIFWLKNGREPNYVSLFAKCGTLPVAMNYQDNGYTCGPTSMSMATMCLFDYKSEKKCADALGTVYGSGTDPSKLVSNAPKLGYTLTPIKREYKAVLKSLQKGRPVIAHIQTAPATCLGYRGDYGHYILIYWCKQGKYYIADPTKGMHKCNASNIDKATNGRNIKYYSVGIK